MIDFSDKIVTTIPLLNIWTNDKELDAHRIAYVTGGQIKGLLEKGQVNFIVADIGLKLKWIDTTECFNFWKSEVQRHLVSDLNIINLDDFPENYAYIGSQWEPADLTPIILLEKVH